MSLEPHTKDDQVVAMDEVDLAEKKLMGVSFQLARALRMGVGHGQEDKVRQNLGGCLLFFLKLTFSPLSEQEPYLC